MGAKEDIAYLEDERKKLWAEVEKLKEQIKKIVPDTVLSVLEKSERINELNEETEKIYVSIANKNQKCSSDASAISENAEESSSKLALIQNLYKQSEELFQKASTNSNELINLSERSKEIKATLDSVTSEIKVKSDALVELNKIQDGIIATEEKINLIHTNVGNFHKEIRSQHTKIFGYTKENEDGTKSKVPGMKDELETSYKNLETELEELHHDIGATLEHSVQNSLEIQKYWESKHSSLVDQIEKLLPGALTTGLSYAYRDKKDIEVKAMDKANKYFFFAILGLIAISLIPFGVSIYMLIHGSLLEEVILKLPRMVMAILPLYIPALWMAYSLSKKVNLSKRLIEEYAHKEALSKTFEGLSGQINNLTDGLEKDELRAKLLYNLLEVSAENPGKLIYDYNNADHPLMDALDKSVKLSEAITKIANIPGMSKLTNVLIEKEKKLKADMDEKAEEGMKVSTEVDQAGKGT